MEQQQRNIFSRGARAFLSAIKGGPRDYTTGSIKKAIFYLAVPMVLEMLMQSFLEVVDIFFVSKLPNSTEAVAAVGLTASLIIIVFALCIGLSMAGTAMVARRIGEGDPEEASRTSIQLIFIGIAFSTPIAILGWIYAPELLGLMGAEQSVIDTGASYCAILFGGNASIFLLFLINAIFRGAGDASLAMKSLWLANGLNMLLDPLLIFGIGSWAGMGVAGAALATTIGRSVGVLYQLKILFGINGQINIKGIPFRPDIEKIKGIVRVGGPGMLQFLISTASWIGVIRIIAYFGSHAVAGYTLAVRLIVFVLLPSWGIGNAAATLVGQNLGAGKADRAKQTVWTTAWINSILLSFLGLILWLFPEQLTRIFTDEPEDIRYSVQCLRILAYSFPFWAVGMVTIQAFNGAGDTTTPTWINLFVFWVLQIPLAYFLAIELNYGTEAVFVAISVAQTLLALFGYYFFKKGKWKTRQV